MPKTPRLTRFLPEGRQRLLRVVRSIFLCPFPSYEKQMTFNPRGLTGLSALLSLICVVSISTPWCMAKDPDAKSKPDSDESAGVESNHEGFLPKPYESKSVVKHPKVIGWPEGKTPQAPAGFRVQAFVRDIEIHVGCMYCLVAMSLFPKLELFPTRQIQRGRRKIIKGQGKRKGNKGIEDGNRRLPNMITLLRDTDGDGKADESKTVLEYLHQPFGMAIFSIQTLRCLHRCGYLPTSILKAHFKLMKDLRKSSICLLVDTITTGREIIGETRSNKDLRLVGSASNVARARYRRGNFASHVLEIHPDGYRSAGLCQRPSQSVGMDLNPVTKELWVAVNERDELGDDLVPDYLTSVKENGFYGWPYQLFWPERGSAPKRGAT